MKKYFVIYGEKGKESAVVLSHSDMKNMAYSVDHEKMRQTTSSISDELDKIECVLMSRYDALGIYSYDFEGLKTFLSESAECSLATGLMALNSAQVFIKDATALLNEKMTDYQKKAIDKIPFPAAGDSEAFAEYQSKVAGVRAMNASNLAHVLMSSR